MRTNRRASCPSGTYCPLPRIWKSRTMSQDDPSFTGSESGGITVALALSAIVTFPLLGPWLSGRSLRPYLEFPPLSTGVGTQVAFFWPVFVGLSALIVCLLAPFIVRVARTNSRGVSTVAGQERTSFGSVRRQYVVPHAFPWWGWGAVAWTICAWFLAWTRFETHWRDSRRMKRWRKRSAVDGCSTRRMTAKSVRHCSAPSSTGSRVRAASTHRPAFDRAGSRSKPRHASALPRCRLLRCEPLPGSVPLQAENEMREIVGLVRRDDEAGHVAVI